MKKQSKFYILLLIGAAIVLITYFNKKKNSTNKTENNFLIQVNTIDNSIQVKNQKLENFKLENIEKILGKPSRVKCDTFKSYYEEFGYDDTPPTSTPYTSHNYYYIYDSLGIMFYTNNDMYETKNPGTLCIHYSNKREFTNTALIPFIPLNSFNGTLEINNNNVLDDKKIVPEGVDYLTENFKIYDMLFGPTSITMNIDRLYSIDSNPYIMLYLNNPSDQKISFVTIQ